MSEVAHIDWETRSAVDLRKTGVYPYAADASTSPWCMSWRIGDKGPVQRWLPGGPDPIALLDHVRAGGTVVAHNAAFERVIWNGCVRQRIAPHWPELKLEQLSCTMSRCAVLGIPQTLEIGSQVLGSIYQKDMKGHALMMKMARPRRIEPDGRIVWWDDKEHVDGLLSYCDQDVIVETDVDLKAPHLSPNERKVWELDQRINDRGVLLDIKTIEHAIKVRDKAKLRINAKIKALTDGAVAKGSEVAKIVAWIKAQGFECESIAKDEQEDILAEADIRAHNLPADEKHPVREVIELRREFSKTSTAKYTAMLACAGKDGRARGLLHYHGTSTGRWAGRLIQPQNLYRVDPERDGNDINIATKLLLDHDSADDALSMIDMLFGGPMTMLAKCLRSMFIAAPGKKLAFGDLANIEGRLQAWFAGEQWKLDAFAAYDAGTGPDLYCVAYGNAFGEPPAEVKKQAGKRQIGKVMELACGYQGSVGSFISMGKNYGLKPDKLVPVIKTIAPEKFSLWMDRYAKAPDKRGLPQEEWAAVKTVVTGWRDAHPKLMQSWWDLQDAAVEAVSSPGRVVFVLDGKVAYTAARGFLWCRLPNGRVLAYCKPRVIATTEVWFERDGVRRNTSDMTLAEIDRAEHDGWVRRERTRRRVDYDGYESEKRRWGTFSLYGGMQFNHIVQGTARDVLVEGMFRLEEAGYPTVLTVHDEVIAEPDENHGSADEMAAIMSINPAWLPGCPLAAKAGEGPRYAK